MTKTELCREIADHAKVTTRQVSAVLEGLLAVARKHVGKGHEVVLPGMLKIHVARRAARKAHKGRHPITGESIMVKAKPASKKVRVTVLKALRDAA